MSVTSADSAGSPVASVSSLAALVTADGSVFEGEHFGAVGSLGISAGEVVFNTAMCGYQEILTDPSYAGQIITFTYPHIGNYGVNAKDAQSRSIFARGVVVRDLTPQPSSWRSELSLEQYMLAAGIAGISGVDTRRLTRLIRNNGSMVAAFGPLEGERAVTVESLQQAVAIESGTSGIDLVDTVTTETSYVVQALDARLAQRRIVALDFGIKEAIVQQLAHLGTVVVLPASATAAEVLAQDPHGLFLSNGPGDPQEVPYAIDTVAELVGKVPIFGICLGHQILALALGGSVKKMPFGHHGANHPVKDLVSGMVEITSQNHNFAVDLDSLDNKVRLSHINLNDGVCQGMVLADGAGFSVQHHPEANPGPSDSAYLFSRFAELMDTGGLSDG